MSIEKLAGRFGPDYPLLHEVSEKMKSPNYRFHHWLRAVREVYLPLGLRRGDTLLDVGCGVGQLGYFLAPFGVRTVGLDANPAAISLGEQRFASPNNTFQFGYAEQLPFANNTFTEVACFDLFEHLPEPNAVMALREMRRVLAGRRAAVKITVTEDVESIDKDLTHILKWPAAQWVYWFEKRGWQVVAPTTKDVWNFYRGGIRRNYLHGYFLLEKFPSGLGYL